MAKSKYKVIPIRGTGQAYQISEERASNTIGIKLSQARKNLGMSQEQFNNHLKSYGIQISKGAYSKWETGETVPNAYQFLALTAALDIENPVRYFSSQYTPALNEEGRRKVAEYRADLVATGKYRPQPTTPPAQLVPFREMPVSNLTASAGTGAFLDEGQFEMLRFPEDQVPENAEFGIRVSGDSMEPVFHNDQIVWVQQTDHISVGEVGIFILDGEGYIKAYDEQEPDEEHRDLYIDSNGICHRQPVLVSYNRAYPPKAVRPTSNFRLIGRVLQQEV